MKIIFKTYLSLLLIAVVLTAHIPAFAQNEEAQINGFLVKAMEKEKIPGLAYAVIVKGKLKTKGVLGYADLSWKQKVTNTTTFQLASVSKVFCGVLLARMFDAGVLSPNQKLAQLLDSIPEGWKDITVLQLAAHQSGIKIGNFSKAENSKQALEIAKKQPLQFTPGESDAYISSDYWILQYIIEKVTGKSYFQVLKQHVLDPLKMENTFVDDWKNGMAQLTEVVPMQARVYHAFQNPDRFVESYFPFTPTGYTAGGLYTSIDDFSKLMLALDQKGFLSPESYQLLTNNIPLKAKQSSFGLGFMVYTYQGKKLVGHSGGPALADVCRFENEGVTVIVLANQRGFYPYLARSIASIFIPGLKPEGAPADYKF